MSSQYQTIEVCEVLAETGLAFLFEIDSQEQWVLKSLIRNPEDIRDGDMYINVEIQKWFVEKEEMV